MTLSAAHIAVILPCRDEAPAIAKVIHEFRMALPQSTIYVIDNASVDGTGAVARAAGAQVINEPIPGKGNAIRRAFAEIDADIYLMADGDGTYEAARSPDMIGALIDDRLDMVVGTRTETAQAAYRYGHRFGNRLFTAILQILFSSTVSDVFSGYRTFSRRFVKSFPALSEGFEIETELTVHALQLRLPTGEMPVLYGSREAGTASKLSTWKDGARILWRVMLLTKQYRPFALYSLIAGILALASLILAAPLLETFIETGLVPRLPTAILAASIMLLAALSLVTGLILHSVSRNALETKRLFYLSWTRTTGFDI